MRSPRDRWHIGQTSSSDSTGTSGFWTGTSGIGRQGGKWFRWAEEGTAQGGPLWVQEGGGGGSCVGGEGASGAQGGEGATLGEEWLEGCQHGKVVW